MGWFEGVCDFHVRRPLGTKMEAPLLFSFSCCNQPAVGMTYSLAGVLVLSVFPLPLSSFVAVPALGALRTGHDQPTSCMHPAGELFACMSTATAHVSVRVDA